MTPQLLIILLSPILPAGAVAHILYKGGKTTGYAAFGALLVYAVSLAMIYLLFRVWVLWPNMPFQAFLLLMPIVVAFLFAWQLKNHGPNR